jgi:hypothetical protein
VIDAAVAADFNPAFGIAAIANVLVTIVANLDILSQNTIAAASGLAGVGAIVLGDSVAVIAGLAGVHTPITADFCSALSVAAVAGLDVPVVTTFDVLTKDSIAAARRLAGVGAGVTLDTVAVITGLASVDSSVAADFDLALSVATVAADFVVIVTSLDALLEDPVTAARLNALRRAAIGVDLIAVIASFTSVQTPVTANLC